MIDNLYIANPDALLEPMIKEYLGLEDIKNREIETLNRLCQFLKTDIFCHYIFENYYLNYQIPQIGKEFDLLRIGKESIINIELKSQKVDDSEILKQLERNYYYLSFLKKKIHCYTFVTDGDINILYQYNKTIEKVNDVNQLINIIKSLNDIDETNINNLFIPSNYLISPFNTTEEFIKDEYFLTKQQEQIKQDIVRKITQSNPSKLFSITGTAGTGKTLITYDIAKTLCSLGKNIIIIHCAQANNGIYKLQSNYGWNIITIRNYSNINTASAEVLIIDEAQRISKSQLEAIVKENSHNYILFSHDVNQKLNRTNQSKVVVEYIKTLSNTNNYTLTNKIRHNKNLASFIKKFFYLSKIKSDDLSKNDYENISFYFTKDINDAHIYVEYLKSQDWEHIYLSNSLHTPDPLDALVFSSNNSAHKVIGQEFDNVVVTIDKNFYYTETLKLSYRVSTYYNPLETLFQAVTRTRKKLTFVIIDNEEVYKNCIKIINRD